MMSQEQPANMEQISKLIPLFPAMKLKDSGTENRSNTKVYELVQSYTDGSKILMGHIHIPIDPQKFPWVVTLWKRTKEKEKDERFKSILDPERYGYHRCGTNAKCHPKGALQINNKGKRANPTRWAKHLTKENYKKVLNRYFKAMELA